MYIWGNDTSLQFLCLLSKSYIRAVVSSWVNVLTSEASACLSNAIPSCE